METFVDVFFAEVLFVGIVFVSSIISSFLTTELPVLLANLPFLQLHFAGFQN